MPHDRSQPTRREVLRRAAMAAAAAALPYPAEAMDEQTVCRLAPVPIQDVAIDDA